MSARILDSLSRRFGDRILETSSFRGDETAVVQADALLEVCRFLREDPAMAFDMPIDVTAVDYLGHPEPPAARFMVVYHLRSMTHGHRIRLKVPAAAEAPEVDSVTGVWRGVDWFEREVWDMYGIRFRGHPDLRRILTYPEFRGHPLRKDYPVRGYQPLMDMPTLSGDPLPPDAGEDS